MEKTKRKKNNKGFSLVELIVVMAIMAILAVTLTPRLSQYIDKARQANDRELPNAVFTAVRLALLDESNIQHANAQKWKDGVKILESYYDYASGVWTSENNTTDAFELEIVQVLGESFKFQSTLAKSGGNNTEIYVKITDAASGQFAVFFTYDRKTIVYSLDSSEVLGRTAITAPTLAQRVVPVTP